MNGLFIFDFDGTICDSFLTFIEALNHHCEKYRYRRIEPAAIESLREMSSREVLHHLGIPVRTLPFVVRSVRKFLLTRLGGLKSISGISEAITALRANGNQVGCITSNSEELVTEFLKKKNITMDIIVAGSSIFGKARLIRKLMREEGSSLLHDRIYYVGDESRDIESAKRAGVKSVAVAWGFNSYQRLSKEEPDYLCIHPHELLKIV
ncbi:HAD hydrolase-like protein [bacterium]|nr:HAD hydrolase-like protein [bacterium]